jgi:hypothetical protein
MACISPRTLVEKYGEFAHGDPRTERRVVLDKSMLPQIENAGDIRVVASNELLPRFLAHLEEESRNAVHGNVPLLVLVFGHGEPDNFGISIGGLMDQTKHQNLRFEISKLAYIHMRKFHC